MNKGLVTKLEIKDDNWYFNSCAFFHMMMNKDRFINLKLFNGEAADDIIDEEIILTVIETI